MTKTEITTPKNFTERVAELRAEGKRLIDAHHIAMREDRAAQDAAWRALDPERQ